MASVSLSDWQDAAANKGAQRIAAGVDGSLPKTTVMMGKVLNAVDGALADISNTPRGDLETNIQRSANFARGMAARAPKRTG